MDTTFHRVLRPSTRDGLGRRDGRQPLALRRPHTKRSDPPTPVVTTATPIDVRDVFPEFDVWLAIKCSDKALDDWTQHARPHGRLVAELVKAREAAVDSFPVGPLAFERDRGDATGDVDAILRITNEGTGSGFRGGFRRGSDQRRRTYVFKVDIRAIAPIVRSCSVVVVKSGSIHSTNVLSATLTGGG